MLIIVYCKCVFNHLDNGIRINQSKILVNRSKESFWLILLVLCEVNDEIKALLYCLTETNVNG